MLRHYNIEVDLPEGMILFEHAEAKKILEDAKTAGHGGTFGLPGGDSKRKDDEGRVPYVRYQQDL